MIIVPGRSTGGADSTRKSDTFSGVVWADPVLPATDGVTINDIFFAPGARTFWHHHLAISLGATVWAEEVADTRCAGPSHD